MGYSPTLDAIVIQGGMTGPNSHTTETWMFDNGLLVWRQVTTLGEPFGEREYHHLASDTCNYSAIMWEQPPNQAAPFLPTWVMR